MDLVGQRLKFLREKAHLTQAKMATILGASQPAINRYEHGQTAAPFSILRSYTGTDPTLPATRKCKNLWRCALNLVLQ